MRVLIDFDTSHPMPNNQIAEFTFCGDLVGVSTLYSTAPDHAYNYLSQFYNTVFNELEGYQRGSPARSVYMFSDSVIVTGDSPEAFVRSMARVYMALLNGSMLLRGGMVSGRLEFDPRRTRENFQKNLPTGDSLARANGLEKSVKGARFLISPDIARQVIAPKEDWLTLQGYIHDTMKGRHMELQRSVAPLATGGGFEVLYPVLFPEQVGEDLIRRDMERMRYLALAAPADISVHHNETIRLLQHSLERRSHMKPQENES